MFHQCRPTPFCSLDVLLDEEANVCPGMGEKPNIVQNINLNQQNDVTNKRFYFSKLVEASIARSGDVGEAFGVLRRRRERRMTSRSRQHCKEGLVAMGLDEGSGFVSQA